MLKDRRLGKFEVPLQILNEEPEAMKTLMNDLIVVEASNSFVTGSVHYTVICSDFEEVEEGVEIPHYDPEFDMETNTVTWTQME